MVSTQFETYSSNWNLFPRAGFNIKHLWKPPDRLPIFMYKTWRRTAPAPHTSQIYSQLLAGPSATLDDKTHLKNYHIPYDPCRVYLPAFGWFMVNVGKDTSPMDPMGIPVVWKKNANSSSKASKRLDEKLTQRKWEWGFITLQRVDSDLVSC